MKRLSKLTVMIALCSGCGGIESGDIQSHSAATLVCGEPTARTVNGVYTVTSTCYEQEPEIVTEALGTTTTATPSGGGSGGTSPTTTTTTNTSTTNTNTTTQPNPTTLTDCERVTSFQAGFEGENGKKLRDWFELLRKTVPYGNNSYVNNKDVFLSFINKTSLNGVFGDTTCIGNSFLGTKTFVINVYAGNHIGSTRREIKDTVAHEFRHVWQSMNYNLACKDNGIFTEVFYERDARVFAGQQVTKSVGPSTCP